VTALLDLAERCEKAEGPDRKLNRDIAQAVEGEVYPAWSIFNSSRYTASVDAALTLVPEGYLLGLTNVADGAAPDFSKATALVARLPDEQTQPAVAASMALAICAAALRARAANA
jgi:hypothetical protein